MVVYNAGAKELTAKIVYYGPGLGGKTTNLQFLHRRLEPTSVGNLLTLAADAERTIYFDLLPVELGDLKGYRIRFQVATVPGQTPYNETRRLVLRGADGLVFVADSRWSMLPKNLESLQNLRENLALEGLEFEKLPMVVQFNKRDLPDVLGVEALQEGLGLGKLPCTEAVATEGKGVIETFKLVSKLTFVEIVRRLQKREIGPGRGRESGRIAAWKNKVVTTPAAGAPGRETATPPVRTGAIAIPSEAGNDAGPLLKAVPQAPEESEPFPEAGRLSTEDTNPAIRSAPVPAALERPPIPAAGISLRATAPGARPPLAPAPDVVGEVRRAVGSLRGEFEDLRRTFDDSRRDAETAISELRDGLEGLRASSADAAARAGELSARIAGAGDDLRAFEERLESRSRSVEAAAADIRRDLETRMERAERVLEDFSVRTIEESAGLREKCEDFERRLSALLRDVETGSAEAGRLRAQLADGLEGIAREIRRSRTAAEET
jgi:signal recognition particle receptor subunit beta